MTTRCWLISILTALAVTCSGAAQTVDLSETSLTGSCLRCELTLALKGKIKVQQEGKPREYPHEAEATHVYVERVLDGTLGSEKVVRSYASAAGTITFDGQPLKRALRSERTFLAVHRVNERLVPFSHKGALAREELELTEHFDALAVPGLLPGKQVAVGATWPLPNRVAAFLCDLEALAEHNLSCKLDSVEAKRARVSIAGSASGVGQGAAVKLLVTGSYDFDLESKRITAVEWKQSDQRDKGPVSPALSADVVVNLKRTVIPEPEELSDTALAPVKEYEAPPARLTNITFRQSGGRYVLEHARDWHVVSPEASEQLVMRLMERGQFIAQATVTPWKKVDAKDALTLEEFAALMAKTPTWAEEKVSEQAELKDNPDGVRIYRITATGELDGVRSVMSFYLLISKDSDQVIVTFSMLPTYVTNLRERDLELIRNISFPQTTASK
jgi:hypothetical protein